VPVHFSSGVWGLLAGGLFTAPKYYQEAYGGADFYTCAGLFYGGSGNQMGANIVFMLVTIPWNLATVGLLFWQCQRMGILRISRLVEMAGVDQMHHNDGAGDDEDEMEMTYGAGKERGSGELENGPPLGMPMFIPEEGKALPP